jgi:protein O-GlcNAc transferase
MMSAAEAAAFRRRLAAATHYFEFGAGGSTVAATEIPTLSTIRSVESDPAWIRRILPWLDARCEVAHGDIGPVGHLGYPTRGAAAADLFPNYTHAPLWRLGAPVPDLVLVDGRFRVVCACEALLRTPAATICIHDFWNRPQYHALLSLLEVEERVETLGVFKRKDGVTDTEIMNIMEQYRLKGD